MATEVYRSFEGFLSHENPEGFIVREFPSSYEVEYCSIDPEVICPRFRFPKSELPASIDWKSSDEWLTQMYLNIDHGHVEGATVLYKGKWYSPKKIIDRNIKLAEHGVIDRSLDKVYNWRASSQS